MSITSHYYGRTQNGEEIYQYILENAAGMRVAVIEYGCVITNIWVKDNTGELRDVALGYSKLEDYELGGVFGAFIGRYANRIEKSRFTLDGKTYELEPNNGPNHLHYTATTDAPTIINLTNHSYFNLEGQSSGSMLEQTLCLNASTFTEGNAETCPTGRILPVAGTPMDFTRAKPIGRDIQAEYSQLQMCGGYDHNFILDKEPGMLALAAVARSEKTGITMETYTTQPGVQLYTSNSLQNDTRPGKTGGIYGRYQGFCLETQHYPCTPSHPEFPSVELRPGEEYHETTIYKFLTE